MPQAVDHPAILGRYRNTCIISAGVIGASWTALFLAHGLNVVVNDPQPDIEATVRTMLTKSAPTLRALGLPHEALDKNSASSLTSNAQLPAPT
jgi:ketoreductase RED1